jgi:hypothetical protein
MRSMKVAMAPRTVAATTRAEAPAAPTPQQGQAVDGPDPAVGPLMEHHLGRLRRQTIFQAIS